jgi:hypothetical protein
VHVQCLHLTQQHVSEHPLPFSHHHTLKTVFGSHDDIKEFRHSFVFCVFPYRHTFSRSGLLESVNIDLSLLLQLRVNVCDITYLLVPSHCVFTKYYSHGKNTITGSLIRMYIMKISSSHSSISHVIQAVCVLIAKL